MSEAGEMSPLQSFIEDTYKDYEKTQRELKEIDILIKQSAAEVERWAQRNAQVTNDSRQLQTNLETVPREYIVEKFEALTNTQQRLFTMRGQLEKLQSDQRNLERLAEFQRRLLESTEGMDVGSVDRPAANPRDQSNVIRVIQTQESERQSLVRRMHDGPASSLTTSTQKTFMSWKNARPSGHCSGTESGTISPLRKAIISTCKAPSRSLRKSK